MRRLHKYLHEFDFPTSDHLRQIKPMLVEMYKERKQNANGDFPAYDFGLNNTPFSNYFNDKVKDLIEDYYILEPTKYPIGFNAFIQNGEGSPSYFHNHIHGPGTICGVMYLDVPKEGGEFEIIHYPNQGPERPHRIKPEEDKLYLFPAWLYHRPLPQKSTDFRVCVNLSYSSNSRPIVKNWGTLW